MNIRKKFLLTPAVVLALMLLLGIVGMVGMSMSKGSLSGLYNVEFQSFKRSSVALQNLGAAHADVYRLFTWLNNYDDKQIKAEAAKINSRIDVAVENLKFLKESAYSEEEQKEVDEVQEKLAKYRKQVANAIDMVQVDPNLGITSMQAADRLFTDLRTSSETLVGRIDEHARNSYERSVTVFRLAVTVFILLVIAAFVIGNFLSFYMSRLIISPLKEAIASAQRIASGDLTGMIRISQKDETGDLLRALADMQEKLRAMIGNLSRSAHELTNMSANLANSSSSIVRGTAEQHDSASSMAASIEQMSVSINVVSENATDADGAVGESAKLSRKGKLTLQEMNAAMQKISSSVNDSARIIENLGRESAKISEIVNVIKDIADQTNLLALNAAIEAARAGEQGRGFAVVADEVRKLAERTTNSTQEITEMILAIQNNTQGAVSSMKDGVDFVSRGGEMTAEAASVMVEVEQKSTMVSGMVSEISTALKEQGEASHEIATHVEKIAQMAEQNTVASREVADSVEQMNSLAANMAGLVSQFKA